MLPLNPPANDVAFRANFPFLAPARGTPPGAPGTGSGFTLIDNQPLSANARVDRVGMPAVALALIGSDQKIAYNHADPGTMPRACSRPS